MNKRKQTTSRSETMKVGAALAEHLDCSDVVGLKGPLGAGKTVLSKGIARGLGVKDAEERVTSPTYTLQNKFEGNITVFHCDAYRLEDETELYNLGWNEQFGEGLFLIEWVDRLEPEITPFLTVQIRIEMEGETKRTIHIQEAST